ncbi:MAG: YaiI/YqxD family protein, partial [Azonexus sp.]
MQIWVDADACPGVIKEIIVRAAERRQIQTILVSNQMLRTPPSKFIRSI